MEKKKKKLYVKLYWEKVKEKKNNYFIFKLYLNNDTWYYCTYLIINYDYCYCWQEEKKIQFMFMKKKNYDIKKYRKILNGNDNFSIWSDKKKWNFKWRDEKIKSDEKKTNEREYWKKYTRHSAK